MCMGPWSEHGTSWYNCNRFEEKAGVDARDHQAKSRASLERYLHVCDVILFFSLVELTVMCSTTIAMRTTSNPQS